MERCATCTWWDRHNDALQGGRRMCILTFSADIDPPEIKNSLARVIDDQTMHALWAHAQFGCIQHEPREEDAMKLEPGSPDLNAFDAIHEDAFTKVMTWCGQELERRGWPYGIVVTPTADGPHAICASLATQGQTYTVWGDSGLAAAANMAVLIQRLHTKDIVDAPH